MEIGKRIGEIRKRNNLTQEELAGKYSVTRQTISNWENGKNYPDLDTLVKISDDFNISLDDLLKDDRNMIEGITKEQKHGKYFRTKIIFAFILGIILLMIAILVLNNMVLHLTPDKYSITVKLVTLKNIEIDEVNKVAVYKDIEGGNYLIEDDSIEEGGYYEAPEVGVYVFKGEQFASLMHYGCVYEIIVESGKSIDGLYVNREGDKDISIDVLHKPNIFSNRANTRKMLMWYSDFENIYDRKTQDLVWMQ